VICTVGIVSGAPKLYARIGVGQRDATPWAATTASYFGRFIYFWKFRISHYILEILEEEK